MKGFGVCPVSLEFGLQVGFFSSFFPSLERASDHSWLRAGVRRFGGNLGTTDRFTFVGHSCFQPFPFIFS